MARNAVQTPLPADLHAIAGWMQSKDTILNQVQDYKGGWELWAQTELNYYFEKVNPAVMQKYGVYREFKIYQNSQKKTDFLLGAHNPAVDANLTIELKCAGPWQFHKDGDFKDTIEKEIIGKVTKERINADLRPPACPRSTRSYTVGLSSKQSDLLNYNNIDPDIYEGPVRYAAITNAQGIQFYLIWHVVDWR